MKAIIRFFMFLWRFLFPKNEVVTDRVENAKDEATEDVRKIYQHRTVHSQHNNRKNTCKRGKNSRLMTAQHIGSKTIYHDKK